MPRIQINDPATGSEKPQAFDVNGWTDAAAGTAVICTINKGTAFSQTVTTTVLASGDWTAPLGAPPKPLIPPDDNYAITAIVNDGGVASHEIDEVNVRLAPEIDITQLRFFLVDDNTRVLNISGTVAAGAAFDALSVQVLRFRQQQGFKVFSAGWIKPIPPNPWKIRLLAPNSDRIVVQVLGIDTAASGEVIARATRKKK